MPALATARSTIKPKVPTKPPFAASGGGGLVAPTAEEASTGAPEAARAPMPMPTGPGAGVGVGGGAANGFGVGAGGGGAGVGAGVVDGDTGSSKSGEAKPGSSVVDNSNAASVVVAVVGASAAIVLAGVAAAALAGGDGEAGSAANMPLPQLLGPLVAPGLDPISESDPESQQEKVDQNVKCSQ
mmetsp:Transcript_96101/g.258339  ORF Transcript_96101/g.258339 Transcript_96101/m.258339 type:complete len:184 (-) Transcript_96101:243-794(-)